MNRCSELFEIQNLNFLKQCGYVLIKLKLELKTNSVWPRIHIMLRRISEEYGEEPPKFEHQTIQNSIQWILSSYWVPVTRFQWLECFQLLQNLKSNWMPVQPSNRQYQIRDSRKHWRNMDLIGLNRRNLLVHPRSLWRVWDSDWITHSSSSDWTNSFGSCALILLKLITWERRALEFNREKFVIRSRI